jgi:hypothetical protein
VARKAGLLKDEKIAPAGVKDAPAFKEAVKAPTVEVKKPAKPGEPASATTDLKVEPTTAPPASGSYTFLVDPTPDAIADIKKEATSQLIAGPARETKIAEAQAQRDSIVKQRDASAAMVGPLNELATSLVSYNQNGVLQTGFGADAYVQFNRVLNSMLRAVGAPKEWQSEIPTAANIEDKVSRLITEAKAGNLDLLFDVFVDADDDVEHIADLDGGGHNHALGTSIKMALNRLGCQKLARALQDDLDA